MYTIGQEEKRKLKEIVAVFRGFSMFESLRANVIERIYKYMESRDFVRG